MYLRLTYLIQTSEWVIAYSHEFYYQTNYLALCNIRVFSNYKINLIVSTVISPSNADAIALSRKQSYISI